MFVVMFLLVVGGIILILVDAASKHFLNIVQIQERVKRWTRVFELVLSQPFPSLLLFSNSFLLSVLVWEQFMAGVLIKTKIKIMVAMAGLIRRREIVLRFLWTR